jgi:N-acetylmuramic acid 6-phosphate etherase
MNTSLGDLLTEERNPVSSNLDLESVEGILGIINREDQKVAKAVAKEIPQIARAVELIVAAFHRQGRLIYIGAGTSGRLGILDASECSPTFNVTSSMVQGVIAGGLQAAVKSTDVSEDNEQAGVTALKKRKVNARDVVVGIAASGRTPYTLGAMKYAGSIGASVISITCNPRSPMAQFADISIAPIVGPEVVAGSTRMKSGTAQKLVLNMLSTASMIRLGYVYSNLMIRVQMKNSKLRDRGRRIIMAVTGVDSDTASITLQRARGDIRIAIIMLGCGVSRENAWQRLRKSNMNLRQALTHLRKSNHKNDKNRSTRSKGNTA